MLLRITGNVCVALAMVLYVLVLWMLNIESHEHDGAQSQAWGLILLLLPLWFCLAIALCASNAAGGLDWLPVGKSARYALVVVVCIAMGAVTILSGILRHEKADQIPWAMHPFVPGAWAAWTFPLIVMCFCLLTINKDLGASVPGPILRAPLAIAGGLSLLVSFGMLAQWFVYSQQREAARADALISAGTERTSKQIEELQAIDAQQNFGQVLLYTNKFHDANVRALALQKIRAVPDLESQLAAGMRGPYADGALMFLDAGDPPDRKPLAEPALDAFAALTDRARGFMHDGGVLRPEMFDYDTHLLLAAADKLGGLGVDYVPAVRGYREVLTEPHQPKVKFSCTPLLDAWLARHGAGAGQ